MDPTRKIPGATAIGSLLRKVAKTVADRLAPKPPGDPPKPAGIPEEKPPVSPADRIVEPRPPIEVVVPERLEPPTIAAVIIGDWVPPEIRNEVEQHWPALSVVSVDALDISVRLANALSGARIFTLGDALQQSGQNLLKIRGFGRGSLTELRDTLRDVLAKVKVGSPLVVEAPLTATIGNWVPPDIRDATVKHQAALSVIPVNKLDISVRLANCLVAAGIHDLGEALRLSEQDWLKTRNFGRKSLVELREVLRDTVAGISGGGRFGVQVSSGPEEALSVSVARDSLGDWSWRFSGISPEQLELLRQVPFDNPAPGRYYFLGVPVKGRLGIFVFDRQVKILGEIVDWSIEDLLKTAGFGRRSLSHLQALLSDVAAKMAASAWNREIALVQSSSSVRTRKNQDLAGNWIPADIREAVLENLEALGQIPRTHSSARGFCIGGIRIADAIGRRLLHKRSSLVSLIRRSRRELHQTGFTAEEIEQLGIVLRSLVKQINLKSL